MKKLISPATQEISELFCDSCQKPAASTLKFFFGYGSDHDLEQFRADFCNDCGNQLLLTLQKRYPNIVLEEICLCNSP